MKRPHIFICPPLDGPVTGGTLYNRELLGALAARGISVRALTFEAAASDETWDASAARVWVDSLYLEHVPALHRAASERGIASLGLVVHYLPSLVALGRAPRRAELSSEERAAIETARHFITTSAFMRDVLAGAGVSAASIVTIEPGLDWIGEPSTANDGADTDGSGPLSAGRASRAGESLDALMIANLLPGKGIAPFLRALDAALDEADSLRSSTKKAAVLRLAIAGSAELDVGYASECRDVLAASPRARRAVRFEGTLPRRVLVERLSTADVLVSASRTESFGMALAEARALGVPILAREGGNAMSLVDPRSGGELFADDADLARVLVRLASDRDELLARAARARSHRIRRSWFDAAAEFAAAFEPKRL